MNKTDATVSKLVLPLVALALAVAMYRGHDLPVVALIVLGGGLLYVIGSSK